MTLRLNKRGIRGVDVKAHYDPHYDPGPVSRPFRSTASSIQISRLHLSQSTGARTWGKGAECGAGGGPERKPSANNARMLRLFTEYTPIERAIHVRHALMRILACGDLGMLRESGV